MTSETKTSNVFVIVDDWLKEGLVRIRRLDAFLYVRNAWRETYRAVTLRIWPRTSTELLLKWKDTWRVFDQASAVLSDQPEDAPLQSSWMRHFANNERMLRTVFRETGEFLKSCSRTLRATPNYESGRRIYEIAQALFISTRLTFDEDGLRRHCGSIQETRPLLLAELEGLRPMLQLLLLEQIATTLVGLLGAGHPDELFSQASDDLSNQLVALREIGEIRWDEFTEDLSLMHKVLSLDPLCAYKQMDLDGRLMYRSVAQEIASRSHTNELTVARIALGLALKESQKAVAPLMRRRSHIGFFLVDNGRKELEQQCGYHPRLMTRFSRLISRRPTTSYVVSVLSFMALAITPLVLHQTSVIFVVAASLLLLIPMSECAVQSTDQLIALLFPPRIIPKLDYSVGIPDECSTIVAVPVILEGGEQVQQLVRDLEVRYLGNRDSNLHFALLTDLPDSLTPTEYNHPLVSLCSKLVTDLNSKYADRGGGRFFHFHRRQIYDPSQDRWTGWERKRGKLLEFNALIRGDCSAFPVRIGNSSVLPTIKYVITLDFDTKLPAGCAHRLIGAIAHPLNRAVVEPESTIVKEGYGILQPGIAISSKSACRSRFSRLFSGGSGFDIYTNAVSNTYQDLCGEGTFTGKGIYDVDVACRILSDTFPPHLILSHDLLEGAHARTGLLSDIELIEDYPPDFRAFVSRKHRWIRGDWQTAFWMLPRVPNCHGNWILNHLLPISRWKILDNLRRSLLELSVVLLLFGGWFLLPGGKGYWTNVALALLALPLITRFLFSIMRLRCSNISDALRASSRRLFVDMTQATVLLVLSPAIAVVAVDAVGRALWRMCVTRRNLLEWHTASQAASSTQRSFLLPSALISSVIWGSTCAYLLLFCRSDQFSLEIIPLLSLWIGAPALCGWLNAPIVRKAFPFDSSDQEMLRELALRTWLFFKNYCGEQTNWLIPDNVWLEPETVSTRTSPTNVGLLLNSRVAAYLLGFVTLQEFVSATEATLATLKQLHRYRGHWFNWYDIKSRQPEVPRFVSTVDSGNLVASLLTLKQCCVISLKQTQSLEVLWLGLSDHVRLVLTFARVYRTLEMAPHLDALRSFLLMTNQHQRQHALPVLRETLIRLLDDHNADSDPDAANLTWAASEALARISALVDRMQSDRVVSSNSMENGTDDVSPIAQPWVCRLSEIISQIDQLIAVMDFKFLYPQRRRRLSVGFDVEKMEHHGSSYDLLASESRTAVLIAIAKGDLPSKVWFALGRPHTRIEGRTILRSWAGTMFEYLMPNLWMTLHPRSLLESAAQAAIESQASLSRWTRKPWGLSESVCSQRSADGSYEYVAFGMAELSLRPHSPQPNLISPYSSILALLARIPSAIANIRLMKDLDWMGRFGFFEGVRIGPANDSRVSDDIMKCWMAHHQGMSLLAICNVLTDCSIQQLFHREPMIVAVDRLLEERFPVGTWVEEGRAVGHRSRIESISTICT